MPFGRRISSFYGIIQSRHIFLRIKLEFRLFRQWRRLFISCKAAFIIIFLVKLLLFSCERFICAAKRRFICTFIINIVTLFINFIPKKLDPANSTKVVFCQQLFKQFLSFLRNLVFLKRQHYLITINCIDKHSYWFWLKRANSKEHFIKYYSKWPNICLHCIIFTP